MNTPKWKFVEDFLVAMKDVPNFTSHDYADYYDIDYLTASDHLQAYKVAQRSQKSKTQFMLHRVPGTRTRNAVWRAGCKKQDAVMRGRTLSSDMHTMVDDAYKPDMERIEAVNPRIAKRVNRAISAVVKNAMEAMDLIIENALLVEE